MLFVKNLESKLDRILIHKKLHENFEELGRARFVVYALISSSLFVSIYTFSLEFSGNELPLIKTIANYFGVTLGFGCIVAVRLFGSIKTAVLLNLILGTSFVVVSAYYSGGILSVDMFWFIMLAMIAYLFVGPKAGVAMSINAAVIISLFYIAAKSNFRNYWAENQESGLLYEYLNMQFLLIFAALLMYFYMSGTNRIKKELAELKEKQIQDLGDKYRYITNNATDIIAIHLAEGGTTYVSPAVTQILGYSAEEMIGLKYAEMIGYKNADTQPPATVHCQHKNGANVYLEIDYSPVREELEGNKVLISIARDVTDKILENQKIAQLREQLANDFHDEMGNKLAAITLSSNLLSLQINENDKAKNTLNTIEQTSKSLYQNSRDFIWSIDAKSDRLDEIFFYLKDFAEDLLQNMPINLLTIAPKLNEMSPHHLPMYSGRHIILIFKEAITNVLKHSAATEITLEMQVNKSEFILSVKDNGKGFSENKGKGKGLTSMKKRNDRIGYNLSWDSNENGTTVCLKGKLPKQGSTVNSGIS